jgi:ParB family chromosome partitioning protein
VVRETTPAQSLELALIENIHRKDLNPIEEAMAYSRLLESTGVTQESLAARLGRDRATIANTVRLLKLPASIQKDLMENRLSMGHARVLAGLKDGLEQKAMRDEIIRKDLSVRQTEALVKKRSRLGASKLRARGRDPYLQSLADSLKNALGTKVEIRKRGKQGSILIYFYSDEELDRLLEVLG